MSGDAGTTYEQIGDEPRPDRRPSRGWSVLTVVAVVVAVLAGGSAFAVYKLFAAEGAQPAEALPASTIAVVSVDLDPSAGQKIEAIRTLRKFPAFKEKVGLDAQDDLRRFFFDKLVEEGDCSGLSFADDIEPWLGKRAAFGAVDLGGDVPTPVLALQVSDADGARAGFDKVAGCADTGEDFGYVVTDDYLVASDSEANAKKIVAQAAKGTLAEDAAYQRWTDEAGDPGVLNVYVAEAAKDVLAKGIEEFDDGVAEGFTGGVDPELLSDRLDTFGGLAATLRFADGGMELAFAGEGVDQYVGSGGVGPQVGDLPADTVAVLAFSVPDDFVATLLDQLQAAVGDELDSGIAEFEAETGLSVPDDVQALLGDALSISLGSDAPASLNDVQSPADVPFGLLISGDADRVDGVIGKLEQSAGTTLEDLEVAHRKGDGKVVLASSDEYADALLKDGSLADNKAFAAAVPEADKALGVLFVDFDTDWIDAIAQAYSDDTGEDASDISANLEPLDALGISAWEEGKVSHGLLKVTTD
jgi:hypothetical protein